MIHLTIQSKRFVWPSLTKKQQRAYLNHCFTSGGEEFFKGSLIDMCNGIAHLKFKHLILYTDSTQTNVLFRCAEDAVLFKTFVT